METSVLEFARVLANRGVRVMLAAPGDGLRLPAGVEHVPLPMGTRHRRAEQDPQLLIAAERLARAHRHEWIIHSMVPMRGAHIYMPRAGIYHFIFTHSAMSCETELSRRLHLLGLAVNPKRQRLIRRQRAIIADPAGPVVAALSEFVRDCVLEICGDVSARIRVVRNGVDVSRLSGIEEQRGASRAALGVPPEATLFSMVAHNFRLKGVYPFIRAMGALRAARPELPFIGLIAGSGRMKKALALIRKVDLESNVRMLGAVGDIRGLYAATDVLVHPTFYDPASRVVLEALAVGLPVITTQWNGSGEFIAGTDAGVVLRDPRDLPSFREALISFCDPDVRARARAAIRAGDLRRRVSMDRHADDVLALYREFT